MLGPMKCTIFFVPLLCLFLSVLRQVFGSAPFAGGAQVNCHLCESARGLPMRHMVTNLLQLNKVQELTYTHSMAPWGSIKYIFDII